MSNPPVYCNPGWDLSSVASRWRFSSWKCDLHETPVLLSAGMTVSHTVITCSKCMLNAMFLPWDEILASGSIIITLLLPSIRFAQVGVILNTTFDFLVWVKRMCNNLWLFFPSKFILSNCCYKKKMPAATVILSPRLLAISRTFLEHQMDPSPPFSEYWAGFSLENSLFSKLLIATIVQWGIW